MSEQRKSRKNNLFRLRSFSPFHRLLFARGRSFKKTAQRFALGGFICMVFFSAACLSPGTAPKKENGMADASLAQAAECLRRSVRALADPANPPVSAEPGGAWKTAGIYDWRSGFFSGCLWYAYEFTRDETLEAAAVRWTEALEPAQWFKGNHDVGFMMFTSFGNGYRITGNPAYRDILLEAARSLSTRFNEKVGSILSWDQDSRWKFPVIIDNMMNLELLFWAAKNGGGEEFRRIAMAHALTTLKNHVRPDGSTFHVVDYDPETGAVRARKTWQGYADDSAWSRGQAWGLYGFTMAYRETTHQVFLETARRIADYFIAHLLDDSVPWWDFHASGIPSEPRDSSAAAIAASGLLELAGLVPERAVSETYRMTALSILRSLSGPPYRAGEGLNTAILAHATGNKPHGAEIDISLIYGDYYYIEALLRLKKAR